MRKKLICTGIFLIILVSGIQSFNVKSKNMELKEIANGQTEYKEKLIPKEFDITKRIEKGLDIEFDNSVYDPNKQFIKNNSMGTLKIVFEPPYHSDWVKHKNKYGICDCWQEDTYIDGEDGRTNLYSWAGPGAGLATIDVNFQHYEGFRPPKDSTYTFTYKFHQEGEIKIDSMTLIIGSSAARGTASFYYYLWDGDNMFIEKSMMVEDHISVGGSNNDKWTYSKTRAYSNSADLKKDVLYTFGANGIPYVSSDGFVECIATADQYVTESGLKKVEIEWENSPPDTPENIGPENQETDVPINADLKWSCTDPDGYYDTLKYDVYFGTSSNPPRVSKDQKDTSYNPGLLEKGETYYWKIKVIDSKGVEKTSPVWKFTTKENGKSISKIKRDYFSENILNLDNLGYYIKNLILGSKIISNQIIEKILESNIFTIKKDKTLINFINR